VCPSDIACWMLHVGTGLVCAYSVSQFCAVPCAQVCLCAQFGYALPVRSYQCAVAVASASVTIYLTYGGNTTGHSNHSMPRQGSGRQRARIVETAQVSEAWALGTSRRNRKTKPIHDTGSAMALLISGNDTQTLIYA
jgi:hypothetical protein